ncbi:MAG: hypothetical protein ACFFDE_11960, partial [Promethearchaeota archaeon]
EDKIGDADVPTVMAPERGEITLLQMDGKLTKKEFATAIRMAEEGIHQIHEMQKEALLKKYAKIRDQIADVSPEPLEELEEVKEEKLKDEELKPTRKRTKRTTSEKAEEKPKTAKKTKTSKKKKTESSNVTE